MPSAFANLAQALFVIVLLTLPAGRTSTVPGPPAASLLGAGPPASFRATEARLPHGGENASGALAAEANLVAQAIAHDATPISERRARAVAMTVFSLGTVVGAGFLAVFLIKRLL